MNELTGRQRLELALLDEACREIWDCRFPEMCPTDPTDRKRYSAAACALYVYLTDEGITPDKFGPWDRMHLGVAYRYAVVWDSSPYRGDASGLPRDPAGQAAWMDQYFRDHDTGTFAY